MTTNNSINTGYPIGANNGGTGLASPTAHGILVAEGSSAVNPIVLPNGQLLIGSTGADPSAASLTAGSGITITPGAGSITIAATGAMSWTDVTGTTQAMAVNSSYTANNAALVTLTLPSTAAYGSEFRVAWKGAGGWTIAQNASQSIIFGIDTTTVGTGGSLSSTAQGDFVHLVCTVANTTFEVIGSQGNLTVV